MNIDKTQNNSHATQNASVPGEPQGTKQKHMKEMKAPASEKRKTIKYKVNSLEYSIWKVKCRGEYYYQVPTYPNGPGSKRKVKTFSTLENAKAFINILAAGKENSNAMLVHISPKVIAATTLVVSELLPFIEPLGLGLVEAVNEYKQAKLLVGNDSLLTVLKEYKEAKALVGTASLVGTVQDFVRAEWFTKQHTLFFEAMERFLEARRREHCREETIRTLRYSIEPVGRVLRNPPIIDVTRDQLFEAIHRPDRQPRSNRTVYAGLHNFYTWLQGNGYLRPDVATAMDPIKAPKYDLPPPAIIDIKSAATCLKTLGLYGTPEDALSFAMALFTGIRADELQRLHMKHLDWDHKQINVTEELAKLRKGRTVPIPSALEPWLEPFLWRKGPLFGRKDPQIQIARILRLFGIKWKRNWLRHSFCTYRLCLTDDVIETARQAGHSPVTLLRIYTNVDAYKPRAAEYFALTPEACGIKDWPTRVAQWFRSDCPPAAIPTPKKKRKGSGPTLPFPEFGSDNQDAA